MCCWNGCCMKHRKGYDTRYLFIVSGSWSHLVGKLDGWVTIPHNPSKPCQVQKQEYAQQQSYSVTIQLPWEDRWFLIRLANWPSNSNITNHSIPLLKSLAAVVSFDVFSSSNLSQSLSPCCINVPQDWNPAGIAWPSTSKMKTLEEGILQSLAAPITLSSISGSVMRNFALAVLIWWVNSNWVYPGFVPRWDGSMGRFIMREDWETYRRSKLLQLLYRGRPWGTWSVLRVRLVEIY